jgi:hypothetical protein
LRTPTPTPTQNTRTHFFCSEHAGSNRRRVRINFNKMHREEERIKQNKKAKIEGKKERRKER